jgi:hypothetical protein
VVSRDPCEPGTRPVLGKSTCEPEPRAACAPGFAVDGQGCKPVLPVARCTGATREVLGQTVCSNIGTCAAGPAPGATYFVDASFSAGQLDATHVLSLAEALSRAPAAAIIAVAPGTYRESVQSTKSVTIIGSCAKDVVFDGEDTAGRSFLQASGAANVTVQGVTITRYTKAVRAAQGVNVELKDVLLSDNTTNAITVDGSGTRLALRGSAVRGTRSSGAVVETISTNGAESLEITDSALVGNQEFAVTARNTPMLMRGTAVLDTRTNASGTFGTGVLVRGGSAATIERSAFVGNVSEAIAAFAPLQVTESVVSDTAADKAGEYGAGIITDTVAVTLRDVTLARNTGVGLSCERRSKVDAERLVVLDTRARQNALGVGVLATSGASVTLRRSVVSGSLESGVRASAKGSIAIIEDSVIRDTKGGRDGLAGEGVLAYEGGTVQVRGTFITGSREAGATSGEAGSTLTIEGSLIFSTRSNGKGLGGFGARATRGAALNIARSCLRDNRDIGILFGDASSGSIRGVDVAGTRPSDKGTERGRGLEVNGGSSAEVDGVSLFDNMQIGIAVSGADTAMELQHASVVRTLTLPDGSAGRGVNVQRGARAVLRGVAVEGSHQLGVSAVDGDALLEVFDSRIVGTRKGADGFGDGVLGSEARVLLSRCLVEASEGSGLAFRRTRAAVQSSSIVRNAVGVFVDASGSLAQANAETIPDEEGVVRISPDTAFDENETRVGNGLLPVPAAIE